MEDNEKKQDRFGDGKEVFFKATDESEKVGGGEGRVRRVGIVNADSQERAIRRNRAIEKSDNSFVGLVHDAGMLATEETLNPSKDTVSGCDWFEVGWTDQQRTGCTHGGKEKR